MKKTQKQHGTSTHSGGVLAQIGNYVKTYAKNCRDSYYSLLSL